MWRNKMSIRFRDLIKEDTSMVSRRVDLTRVEVVLEDLASKLSEKEQKKLAEIYVELKELAESLNMTPYTIFNHDHWKLLNMILAGKVAEFKLVAEDIAEENKDVDCWPLAKAIDTILI
jgi:O6-methylguanine-DNA--protein-cysteine methyltransferase